MSYALYNIHVNCYRKAILLIRTPSYWIIDYFYAKCYSIAFDIRSRIAGDLAQKLTYTR